ncbi:MAG: flagellar motor protein MotB [Bryobacteraceae bacterium]|jgi:chemotaxis protein MotB
MARKEKHSEHVNHERWLISYADFITLMFAFFVVMFASSQTDKARAQQVSDSVSKALKEGRVGQLMASILGGTPGKKGKGNAMIKGPGGVQTKPTSEEKAKYLVELMPSLLFLSSELKEEIEEGKVALNLEPRGLVISLREAAFFATGQDTISLHAYGTIGAIAEAIKKVPNPVRLEGHTDSVPIHNTRFRSNWDLSVARGISMLTLLRERFEIPERQLSVAGYADNRPTGPNETDEGRARNRRVDVVILNKAGSDYEPGAAPGTPPTVASGAAAEKKL